MKPQLRTPITYYGGKQRMLPYILPLIPSHTIYTEAFVGGGAVFWAKPASPVEVINDLNGAVAIFYRVLKSDFSALKQEVDMTLHSRASHSDAWHVMQRPHLFSDRQVAWAFWVSTNMGYSGMMHAIGFDRLGKKTASIASKRECFGPELAARLAKVQIESRDALHMLASRDYPEAFHYLDPPYFNADCSPYVKGEAGIYKEVDFVALLSLLEKIKGKFLLSSYPSDLLTEFVKRNGWSQRLIEMPLAVNSKLKSRRKTEALTWNYEFPRKHNHDRD